MTDMSRDGVRVASAILADNWGVTHNDIAITFKSLMDDIERLVDPKEQARCYRLLAIKAASLSPIQHTFMAT